MNIVEKSKEAAIDWVAALKEAAIAAAIALGLSIFLLGFRATDAPGGLQLATRFDLMGWAVLAVFAGRFLTAVLRQSGLFDRISASFRKKPSKEISADETRKRRREVKRMTQAFGLLMILFALTLPLLPFSDRYVVNTAIVVVTYVMLGWGLNIVVGLAGLLDLGYVAFYAVGAYSYALISQHYGLSFWICLPLAGVLAATFGILLGFPVLRLRGDYLAIVTLGFGEIIRVVLINWYDFSGGPNGISGIDRPSFFGFPFDRRPDEGVVSFHQLFDISYSPMHRVIFLYYLILVLALITNWAVLRLRKLPIGRAWEALREDEIACRSLGINPTNTKLTAFATGAMFGGFAGAFFATNQGFISPESFVFIESAVILAIVVLGGMGSQIGVVVASVVLIGGFEFFRDLEEFRMLAFGGLMVLIMIWRPSGLLSWREPTVTLDDSPPSSGGTSHNAEPAKAGAAG